MTELTKEQIALDDLAELLGCVDHTTLSDNAMKACKLHGKLSTFIRSLPSPPVSGEALGYMRKSDFEQMQNPGTNYAMIYREYVENYCPVPVYAAAAIPVSEPVAWRIENYPGGEWSYFDSLKSACRYAGDHDKLEPLYASPLTNEAVDVDALAQEIRRVDGNHSLGAGALAEALMPFLSATNEPVGVMISLEDAECLAYASKCLAEHGEYKPLGFNFSDIAGRLSAAIGERG